jgi:hypothetical protein
MKGNEVRSLNASIDSLKSVNEELKVRGSATGVVISIEFCIYFSAHLP